MPHLFISIAIRLKTNLNKKKIEIMATRATIVIRIKDEDLGKKVKVDPSYLTKDEIKIEKYNKKCFEIELSKKYAEIYHHWDGYPEGLGLDLIKHWNSYEKVFNLILAGDQSSIQGDTVTTYVTMEDRDELYKDLQPKFSEECPSVSEDYQYLYDDGKWYVRGTYKIKNWILVEDYLNKYSDN